MARNDRLHCAVVSKIYSTRYYLLTKQAVRLAGLNLVLNLELKKKPTGGWHQEGLFECLELL